MSSVCSAELSRAWCTSSPISAGVDAVGAACRGRLGAETEATGTYLRAETALFWEVAASLDAELLLRARPLEAVDVDLGYGARLRN